MKTCILFHGTKGSPKGNWFPWLKQNLEARNYKVIIPTLPTPEGQTLKGWLDALDEQCTIEDDVILIGHSCGATFLLHVLEGLKNKVAQAHLVSTMHEPIGIDIYDTLNATFYSDNFNWDKIKKAAEEIYIYHGDNDPYVPLTQGQCIADNLNTKLQILVNGGHVNKDSGYKEFPELLNNIIKEGESHDNSNHTI